MGYPPLFMHKSLTTIQPLLKAKYEAEVARGSGTEVHKLRCRHCGGDLYARRADARWCSYRCRNDAYIARRRQWRAAAWEKVCAACGRAFTATRSHARTCSGRCRRALWRARHNAP